MFVFSIILKTIHTTAGHKLLVYYLNIEQSYIIYFGLALFDREHTMQLDTVLRNIFQNMKM